MVGKWSTNMFRMNHDGSEDEKRLKKAKEAESRKSRQPTLGRRGSDKNFKGTSNSTDQQLFCGEVA